MMVIYERISEFSMGRGIIRDPQAENSPGTLPERNASICRDIRLDEQPGVVSSYKFLHTVEDRITCRDFTTYQNKLHTIPNNEQDIGEYGVGNDKFLEIEKCMQLDDGQLEFKREMMDYIENRNANEVKNQNTTEQVENVVGEI